MQLVQQADAATPMLRVRCAHVCGGGGGVCGGGHPLLSRCSTVCTTTMVSTITCTDVSARAAGGGRGLCGHRA